MTDEKMVVESPVEKLSDLSNWNEDDFFHVGVEL